MIRSLRTIFMGTPEFAVPTLEALAAETSLQLVVTQPDRRQGRGKKMVFSPVKSRALDMGIEVIGPSIVKGKKFAARIAAHAPDVIVTAAFGRILGPALLEVPKYGCLNVHASLLPKYRGAAPINWAIINGDSETGVSIMKTVQALDAGDVYTVRRLAIERQTAGELTTQLAQLGADALIDTLRHLDTIVPEPQNEANATVAPMMEKNDGRLEWKRSAEELEHQVRGMHPWPGAFAVWRDVNVKIHAAEVLSAEKPRRSANGSVLAQSLQGVDIACGTGVLRISSLQLPGKKRLDASQFYAGIKFPVGEQFN